MKFLTKMTVLTVMGIVIIWGFEGMATLPEKDGCKFEFVNFTAKDKAGKAIPNVYNLIEGKKTTIKLTEKNKWKYDDNSKKMKGEGSIKKLIVTFRKPVGITPFKVEGFFTKKGETGDWVRSQEVVIIKHHLKRGDLYYNRRRTKTTAHIRIMGLPVLLGPPFVKLTTPSGLSETPEFTVQDRLVGKWTKRVKFEGKHNPIFIESTFFGDFKKGKAKPKR